jgi:hypothetical protein
MKNQIMSLQHMLEMASLFNCFEVFFSIRFSLFYEVGNKLYINGNLHHSGPASYNDNCAKLHGDNWMAPYKVRLNWAVKFARLKF